MTPGLRERMRALLPPAVDEAATGVFHGAKDLADRARLWRWTALGHRAAAGSVAFVGRAGAWPAVRDVFRLDEGGDIPFQEAVRDGACAVACDAPLPGALHVPGAVRLLLQLQPGEDPLRLCSERTRGHLHKLLKKPYRWRRVTEKAEIARVQEDMLAAFALARHRERAFVVPLAEVERIARAGRLDELLLGDEPVGAHLAAPRVRDGRKVWVSVRVGYPEPIFSDRTALGETNAVNWLFASRSALEEGCAVHDMGFSPAAPDNGLLQFKRQRGGALDPHGFISSFWVRLPRRNAPALLWAAPLFALEDGGISLHLGVPAEVPDEQLVRRFRDVGFGGLCAARLHAARPVPAQAMDELAAVLRRRGCAAPIEVIG